MIYFLFQVLASRESLVESLEESESDDAILMSQVNTVSFLLLTSIETLGALLMLP